MEEAIEMEGPHPDKGLGLDMLDTAQQVLPPHAGIEQDGYRSQLKESEDASDEIGAIL